MRHSLRSRIGAVARAQMPRLGVPLCFLVLCLLAWPSPASGADRPLRVERIVPTEAVVIVGPEQVKAGRMAAFQLKGLAAEYLAGFDWLIFNKPDDAMVLDLADRKTGEPVMVFQSETTGRYAIIADINVLPLEGCQLIVHEFTVGETNGPPPPPPPPPPTPAVSALIIEEKDERSNLAPERVFIFESQKVRDLFVEGAFQVRDDDIEGTDGKTPPELVEFIKWANVIGLPALFLLDKDRKVVWEGPVPGDVPATIKLIQGYQ